MGVVRLQLETITLLALAMIVATCRRRHRRLENICRHIDMGKSPREAAIRPPMKSD